MSMRFPRCLNRTSVGLKHDHLRRGENGKGMPQSNQRGIETVVGLGFWEAEDLPQSNQRGIETLFRFPSQGSGQNASIEPAWD